MSEENPTARELHELVTDLQHKRALLQTINKFALRLLSIPTKEELLWFVAREVVGRLGFTDCVIYLIASGGERLRQMAAIGAKNPKGHQIANALEIPIGDGITGTVARTGQALIVDDLSADARYIPDLEPALSEICVPLIIDDTVVGVIDSEDPRRGHFGAEHLEILTVIAAMTSEKLKLIDEAARAEERTRELRRLNDQFREEIAERERIEEALETSRMQIQSIMDHSPAMIFLKDTEGRYVLTNRTFERVFGMTSEQVKGQLPADALPSELANPAHAQDMEVLRTGQASSQELRFLVDGRDVVVLSNKFPILDATGKVTGVGTVASEITERIRAEEVLKESQKRLQSLLDYSPAMVFLKDTEGRYVLANQTFERLFGMSSDEIKGKFPADFLPEDFAAAASAQDREVLRTGQASTLEAQFVVGGQEHIILNHKFPILDDEGMLTGIGTIATDIADRVRAEEVLKESEGRLQSLLDHSPTAIFLKDREGRFQVVNRQFEEWRGLRTGEILGRTSAEVFPSEIAERYEAHDAQVLSTGQASVTEIEVPRADGSLRTLLATKFPVVNPAGDITGIGAVITDITERRRAEEVLKESEKRLQSLLDNSPTAIFLKDREGRFELISRQFQEWLGISTDDVLGKTSTEVFPQEFAELYRAEDERVLATGETSVAEFEFPFADGALHTVMATKFPVANQAGEITGIGAVITDITDRKRAETLLVEAMDVTTTFFILFGPDDRLLICNQGCRDMYETDAEPMVPGAKFEDLIRAFAESAGVGTSEGETNAWVAERLNRRKRLTKNYEYERRDGRWVEVSDYMLGDGSIFTIGSDITDKKHVEAQLRQAQKMKAVGQLTGGVAHDFNNMLTAIIGSLDVIEDRLGDPAAVKRSLDIAMKASLNAADLIQRLLAFSRQQHLDHAVVDLRKTIIDIRGLLRTSVGASVELTLRLAEDVRPIWTDTTQLESAIVNLTINARDAMPDGGTLSIEASNVELDEAYAAQNPDATPGSYAMLSVADTGCGMSADVREHVFEPFFTTKEVGQGTGLGLSMVFGFVSQSGGHVTLHSEEGQGTCVKMFLPVAKETQSTSASALKTNAYRKGGGETILVVEDDVAVRQSASSLLEGLGYRVLLAETGPEALTLLSNHQDVDLLFTDTVMPGGMSGFDLAREVLDRFPRLKVLRTSGYAAKSKSRDAELDRRIDWIAKPYREQPLAEKIREVLESPNNELFAGK